MFKKYGALILAAAGALLLLAGWLDGTQAALADRVLRLHVLAASDSAEDQALKLAVRDRVLERAAELYDPADGFREARAKLAAHLPELAAAGQAAVAGAGRDDRVSARLERAWFPTKRYGGFALPAGEYEALRIVIGPGEGQNWWCVVFPPLCLDAVSERPAQTARAAGLTRAQTALITGEGPAWEIRFRAVELWERVKKRAGG